MLNDSVSKKSVVVRWFTLIGIISGIFILLLALEALVTGEKHPPIVSAAGDLESWSIITCPPVFPSFEDRGMNGWSASGSSSRCWQYAEGEIGISGLTYSGTVHAISFSVNRLDMGERNLYFKPNNCGSYICSTTIHIPETGSYLIHDGSLPAIVTNAYDHVFVANINSGYMRFYVWGGGYLPPATNISIDISSIGIFDNGPWPALPYPLLDAMVWNAFPECPFCGAQNAVGWVGGPINTHSGNLSYQETDLAIPIAGGELTFRRSYASNATEVYTTTLGHGWTHNYDMRLHFDNTVTAISNTVELQAPGGSRLPFFVNEDGTYAPYPGVTAELTYEATTDEYSVIGFNQNMYRFDGRGQLIEQQDAIGNVVTFTYDAQNRLERAEQGDRHLQYGYANGRLTSVTDHSGRVVQLGYDANGDLTAVTNTLGLTSSYEYISHKLTQVTDASGRIVEQTAYDLNGRAYQQWNGAGNLVVDIGYMLANTRIVTENGIVMSHFYDTRNTLVDTVYLCSDGTTGCGSHVNAGYDGNFKTNTVRDAGGNDTHLTWNIGGSNLESATNAVGEITFMDYDDANNLTQVTDARGNATTFSYHPTLITFRIRQIDAVGHTTIYTPTLNTVQNSVVVPDGLLLAEKTADGMVSHYEYNAFGQPLRVVHGVNGSQPLETRYGYDHVGRLITTTQIAARGNQTSLNVYDGGDRLLATIDNWTGSNPANWQADCNLSAGVRDENACMRYGYDSAGRIITVTNTLGQTDLTFYDAAGRVNLTVNNYDGTAYDPANPETSLCDFANPNPEYNICHKTEYDENGRPFRTTNSLGYTTLTKYDTLGRVAGTIENSVSVTELDNCSFVRERSNSDQDVCTLYSYDVAGNVIIVKDAAGRQTRTFYDALNRVVGRIENWTGTMSSLTAMQADCFTLNAQRDYDRCTMTTYDEVGNIIIVTDPLGRQTRLFYNAVGQITTYIQNWQSGFDPTDCVYDADNMSEVNVCMAYGYDMFGRQNSMTNALGQTSLTVYDDMGQPAIVVANWDGLTVIQDEPDCAFPPLTADENVCVMTYYDALGRRIAIQDPLGHMTDFGYDGLSRLSTATRYLNGIPVVETAVYDALGNRRQTTNAENHTTSYSYDTRNRLTTTISPAGTQIHQTYNAAGWVLTQSNNYNHTTLNHYNALGQLLSTTDPEGNATRFIYDILGNQTARIDAEGVRTGYDYDNLNQLTGVIENHSPSLPAFNHEMNVLTQYDYDLLGNRTVITNARNFTQTYTLYDALNRPITVRDALNQATTTSYDALGNVRGIVDANGDVTTFAYDGLNRLITTTYIADNETVVFAYDAVGNRLQMSDNTGVTTYEYDDLGRLIAVTSPEAGTVSYEYDKVGNRTRLIYPDGKAVIYTYNADNRLTQVTDWGTQNVVYSYDAIGRLDGIILPGNIIVTYTYDRANRLTDLTYDDGKSLWPIARYQYELDSVGNRTAVTEALRVPSQYTPQTTATTYQYDPLYRLTHANYSGAVEATFHFQYDATGNMIEEENTIGSNEQAIIRIFNAANQLISAESKQTGTTVYTYDNNGSLIFQNEGIETLGYAYDQRNLLIEATRQVGRGPTMPVSSFAYDGANNRVQQTDYTTQQPATITYANDILGLTQVLVADDGATQTYNLFGLDLISQQALNGIVKSQPRLLLPDGLGSVRQEMVGKNVTAVNTYEPYGTLLNQIGVSATTYGFTGEQEDSATGLLYLRARYYNPSLHTFMVKDSWAGDMLRPETLHSYSYVGGNVINITDPTGQCYGPLRYLRQLESTNCNNLDMAGSIFTNPNASVVQRAGAAAYATSMVGSHAMLAVGTAASGGFGQGLLAYSAGYGGYDMARTNTNSNLLMVPGYILGYENIHRDLITLNNPCASTAQKVVAGGDALLNTVLGASMTSGLLNSAHSIRTAWQLRHLSSAERLIYLQRLGAQSGVEVIESTRFYRPPGTHIIEIPSKALNNASRAAGGYYHELAHVGQEFGKVSTLRGGRLATLPTQGFQAWSARAGGSALEFVPGYLLNPVEVNAFVSGLASGANWLGFAESRFFAYLLNQGANYDNNQ